MSETAERVLGEHREVCAFLMHMLLEAEATHTSPFTWVDLGCGDGRVLLALRGSVPEHLRRCLCYRGFDRADTSAAAQRLQEVGLHPDSCCNRLDLDDLRKPAVSGAGLVTLTNVIHEIHPLGLPSLLVSGLQMLGPAGYLLAYDMEELPDECFWSEWEAVPWSREDMTVIAGSILEKLDVAEPVVAKWTHRTTTGWTLVIGRAMLGQDAALAEAASSCVESARAVIPKLLKGKLNDYTIHWRNIALKMDLSGELDEDRWRSLSEDAAQLPRIYQALHALHRAIEELDEERGRDG